MYAPVSVVIAAYRCEKTIERAVCSIWGQTVVPREVIIVEDFSDDQTRPILEELTTMFPENWLRIIPLGCNVGPASARNLGWEAATQKYLAFLDSDDAWYPRKIELQYLWMEANRHVILTGHKYDVRDCSGDAVGPPVRSFNKLENWKVRPMSLLFANKFSTPTVMVRRDIPFRFETGKRYAEDYLLWLQICLSGSDCRFIDVPLTMLYKPAYGDSGLSSHLAKMYRGELSAYLSLYKQSVLSFFPLLFFCFVSGIKFVRRVAITYVKSL